MFEQVKTDLDRLKAENQLLKDRQDRLEQILEGEANTPKTGVQNALDRLRSFLAAGKADPNSFRQVTDWMELEDLAESLRPINGQLPGELYRQVWSRLRDSRQRLEQNPREVYAVNQLEYIEKVLSKAGRGYLMHP